MNFSFTEEQEELRATARAFLASAVRPSTCAPRWRASSATTSSCGSEDRRRARLDCGGDPRGAAAGSGSRGSSWSRCKSGWARRSLCAPFFASVCLAANAILAAGDAAQQEALLPGIAEGRTRATLAFAEASARWDASGVGATCERSGSDYVLRGEKRLRRGRRERGADRARGARAEIGGRERHLAVRPARGLGGPRARARCPRSTRRGGSPRSGSTACACRRARGSAPKATRGPRSRRALERAAVALAAEQVGGAQRCARSRGRLREGARPVRPRRSARFQASSTSSPT